MPTPCRNEKADFLTIKMAMKELNMCRTGVVELAKEAGALIKYKNIYRIDWNKLSNYFKENYTETE